jgi:hypothetical protein
MSAGLINFLDRDLMNVDIITSSQTWIRPTGVTQVLLIGCGGGAAGYCGYYSAAGVAGGWGGPGAGWSSKVVAVSGNVVVTIGQGGTGSTAIATWNAGGHTTFGALATFRGAAVYSTGTVATNQLAIGPDDLGNSQWMFEAKNFLLSPNQTLGGRASITAYVSSETAGQNSESFVGGVSGSRSGGGGAGPFGNGGAGGASNASGANAASTAYGAGGGGGGQPAGIGTTTRGGDGADGVLYIIYARPKS